MFKKLDDSGVGSKLLIKRTNLYLIHVLPK